MKNILVPTDFSPEAHHAYEVALQVARHTGGSVTLLHVLEGIEDSSGGFSTIGAPVGGNGIDPIFPIKLMEATKRRMHSLVAEAAGQGAGVPVQESIKVAAIGEGILRAIQRHGTDLVVMGARGHGVMEHFFVSSNTERIIRLAPCPVLTVKHPHPHYAVHNIVFPSDFSPETAHALGGLRHVQRVFPEARLHLLHVLSGHGNQTAEQQMQAFAREHELHNYQTAVVDAERTSVGIEQYAEGVQAELVVIPTHARSGLSSFLRASIAETVATHAFPPVLTYHFR